MKYILLFFISTFLFVHNGISQKARHDMNYQLSTFDALMEGQYNTPTPFARLHQHGNYRSFINLSFMAILFSPASLIVVSMMSVIPLPIFRSYSVYPASDTG